MRTRSTFRTIVTSGVLLSLSTPAGAQFVSPKDIPQWGNRSGGSHGWVTSELADLDGDGVLDVAAGAPFARSNRGRVLVYSGATGDELFRYEGLNIGDLIGWSVADAGDVNNDGFSDVMSGGIGVAGGGAVTVLSGNPVNYGHVLLIAQAPLTADPLGYSVSSLGDTNGDGHADMLAGASPSGLATSTGHAYIISGSDGTILHELTGSQAVGGGFGRSAGSVGDLDADGVMDAVIGAPGEGKAYVFSGATGLRILPVLESDADSVSFGNFFAGRCGDVSGDGIPDIYVGDPGGSAAYVYSGADGSRWLKIVGPSGSGLGCGSGLMSDLNSDGHDDLVIGSFNSNDGEASAGLIRVYSGADGSVIRTVTGNIPGLQLGFNATGIGDVNGDGWPDILTGAAGGGWVYVVLGQHPCPADLDGDGDTSLNDIDDFVNAFLGGLLAADFDDSGVLNIDDIDCFVLSFLTGCP